MVTPLLKNKEKNPPALQAGGIFKEAPRAPGLEGRALGDGEEGIQAYYRNPFKPVGIP
jgi:hypothetical protein